MIEQISHIIERVHVYMFKMSSLENRYSKRMVVVIVVVIELINQIEIELN